MVMMAIKMISMLNYDDNDDDDDYDNDKIIIISVKRKISFILFLVFFRREKPHIHFYEGLYMTLYVHKCPFTLYLLLRIFKKVSLIFLFSQRKELQDDLTVNEEPPDDILSGRQHFQQNKCSERICALGAYCHNGRTYGLTDKVI